jgi:hypothetical protein
MEIVEFFKIALPAVFVLITAYLLIDKLLKAEGIRRDFELKKQSNTVITPIRLRAYERLILVLERTSPSILIVDLIKPEMTNGEFHTLLLSTIRQEFSHNLSQQLYVSDDAWNFVRSAQESLFRLVNTCSTKCNPSHSAAELAEIIIQVYNSSDQTPTELAIEKLKNEVRILF